MLYLIDDYPNEHSNGMGVTFNWVVWQMLRHQYEYFKVDIRKPGNPYRDPEHAMNVWEYYFKQDPHYGMQETPATIDEQLMLPLSGHMQWTLDAQQAINSFARINVRPTDQIRDLVDDFKATYFKGRVLGIHLRGTDKATEYQPMLEHELIAAIDKLLTRLQPDTIFLQTDDIDLWKLMQQFKPVSLEIPRSKRALHLNPPTTPFLSGQWAVVDGLLGAACDYYAYTPSNFATISILMGAHKDLSVLNRYCKLRPFPERVKQRLRIS